MKTGKEAIAEVAKIGVAPGDPRYAEMYACALRGWPAWRIAQAWRLAPEVIEILGGPPVHD